MWQNYRQAGTGFFTQTYIVSPSVEEGRVSVRRYPSPYSDVLAYLTTDTVIEVVSKTNYWLYIVLPNKVQGYIYSAYARPATNADLVAMRRGKFPLVCTEDPGSVERVQFRFTAGLASLFVKGWVSLSLFALSFLLFAFGGYLSRGIADCSVASGSICDYPFESLGALLIFIACFVLLLAFVSVVIALAKAFHAHRIK